MHTPPGGGVLSRWERLQERGERERKRKVLRRTSGDGQQEGERGALKEILLRVPLFEVLRAAGGAGSAGASGRAQWLDSRPAGHLSRVTRAHGRMPGRLACSRAGASASGAHVVEGAPAGCALRKPVSTVGACKMAAARRNSKNFSRGELQWKPARQEIRRRRTQQAAS